MQSCSYNNGGGCSNEDKDDVRSPLVIQDGVLISCYIYEEGTVEIPEGVIKIGDGAFKSCGSLTSVKIPNSVTEIGDNAFSDCTGLVDVTIPNSVTKIGSFAFENCSKLKGIDIPSSINAIGGVAVSVKGTNVEISSSVQEIKSGVFSNPYNITSITIPNSVKKIRSGAFKNCTNLKTINYDGTEEQWGKVLEDSNASDVEIIFRVNQGGNGSDSGSGGSQGVDDDKNTGDNTGNGGGSGNQEGNNDNSGSDGNQDADDDKNAGANTGNGGGSGNQGGNNGNGGNGGNQGVDDDKNADGNTGNGGSNDNQGGSGDNTDDMTSNEDNGNTDDMPPNGDNSNTDDIPPNEDNDNTDNDENPQYVWLPVSSSSHSENSNGEGTQEYVYYNNALDYKFIYEFQSEMQTYQGTVISKTALTYVSTERCSSANSVTTTYTYDSDGNKISDLLYQSEAVTTYFEELLPRIFTITKSSYQKLTSNDGNVYENNTDYDLEYLGEENDCKVYKHLLNKGTTYTIYKIKDGMIQEQNHYYDDNLNSITKCSVSSDEFLAELKFQDSVSYDANGNLTSTSKYILNSKNENEASIDLVTSTTTYEYVNSWKYKRFMYPF